MAMAAVSGARLDERRIYSQATPSPSRSRLDE
jgi:hypothetical protein